MKTIKLFLLSLFTVVCAVNMTNAQEKNWQVKGSIIDSLTKKPGEFFTVSLQSNGTALKSVVSDENGNFSIDKIGAGNYLLVIGSLGYNTKHIAVDVKQSVDLGKIWAVSQSNKLEEVSVVASKPVIKQEPDRISYDVQADPESKALSVLDMMRKIPLLSVDADDNVKLKGNGNYKILINGKPSGMLARDPKEVLKNMPASNVQKVEVITTPPSKYESEGLAGLINIITNKKATNGYNGNINLRNQTPGGPGINGNLTLRQGNFGASAYGGTGVWQVDGLKNQDMRLTTGLTSGSLLAIGENKIDNRWAWGGAELSYEIDSLNLITAEINPYAGFNEQNSTRFFNMKDGSQLSNYNMNGITRYEWGGIEYNLNYQLGFKKKKEHLLTLSYKLSDYGNPQHNKVDFLNEVNYSGTNYKQDNESKTKEHTFQLDYINPFKKITVEAGAKVILRDGSAISEHYNLDKTQNVYVYDATQSNIYYNNQNIFGVYNSYTLVLDSTLTFKAGARLEATYVSGDFRSTNSTVKNHYFNLVPSLSFNKKLANSQAISLGFTQRLQRPSIYDLNPFVDKSRPNFEYTGNPDLKAVISNNFELTYSNFKKGSLNLSLSYNFANNTQQTVYQYFEAQNITRITSLNIGKNNLLGLNINFNYPITSKWSANVNGNLNHIWLEGAINGITTKNSGLTGYTSFSSNYKFDNGWKPSISFNYSAPSVMLQGKSNSFYFMGLGVSKDLIKDKLTLFGMVANPFKQYNVYKNLTEGANFTQERLNYNIYRRFSVSLNWKFGKLTDGIKKNERRINNDDTKKSSN
ncbi:outer membrane beta-barrel protein [Pedobacter sp.]|uniref:outer membrane beta-barrel protein n=1 Tax=Pedobacter sp. TaxID=1411316 RepID=UPI00396CE732